MRDPSRHQSQALELLALEHRRLQVSAFAFSLHRGAAGRRQIVEGPVTAWMRQLTTHAIATIRA